MSQVRAPVRSLILLSALLGGCALQGPDAMRASRLAYNEAVQVSDQREQLLNLVRLRYEEVPEFLAVSGISTQMNVEVSASLGGVIGEDGGDDTSLLAPNAGARYAESPTVTFVPQRDEAFTRQLVAPVELDSLYLLTRYGWELDRVLRLLVSDMNGLQNAELRDAIEVLQRLDDARLVRVDVQRRREDLSDPISADSVSASDLLQAANDGYRLERRDAGFVLTGTQTHYVLAVSPDAWQQADAQSMAKLLNVPPRAQFYDIDSTGSADAGAIRLTTRSVLAVMNWLSNAVAVPATHAGLTRAGNAGQFQPQLNVRVSAEPVDGAYLGVEHRDHFFYIDDGDIDSKRTLGLLTALVRLSISAGGAQNVPILTLPVAN